MNYVDFNPYLAQERNQQIFREVDSLRLQKRPWDDDIGSSGSRIFALACGSALPLLRGAGLTR
jgi:hypothetical protein